MYSKKSMLIPNNNISIGFRESDGARAVRVCLYPQMYFIWNPMRRRLYVKT